MWLHILHDIRDFGPNMKHIPRTARAILNSAIGNEISFGSRLSLELEERQQARKGRFERLSPYRLLNRQRLSKISPTRRMCHLMTLFRKMGWPAMRAVHVPNAVAALFILLVSTQVVAADDYYVTAERLNVRSGPATSYSAVSALHRGARVTAYAYQGPWFRISDLASAGLWVHSEHLSALRPADKDGSVNLRALNSCKAWLINRTGYRFFAETERIQEYEQAGEYRLRSNLLVITALQQLAEVGFECTVYLDEGTIGAFVDIRKFEPEGTVSTSAANLKERRTKWGGSGCASISVWKKLVDNIQKGNYLEDETKECTWLEKGTRVYGPIEQVEYRGSKFARVRLASGRKVWIEPSIY